MLAYVIQNLELNKEIFSKLLVNKSSTEYKWKQEESKWCLLEIVGHLIDEEIYDFRTRLKTVMDTPGIFPPPIYPVEWVKEHDYINQDYNKQVQRFIEERSISLQYLRKLSVPPLENFYPHPSLGNLSGHHFLNNWLAHDYLHIKQITRLNYDFLAAQSSVPISYAGKWT
ncbi:MAG: DinB family protein [Bacteroidota bacterium]